MRILVIEDDRAVRETLGIVLESYHYSVDLLEDPDSVLQYLKYTWPDLILLDLRLEGGNGIDLYKKIQENFGAVPPTVVLSAVQHGEEKVRQLPGVRFLSKPYSLDELLYVVKEMAIGRGAA